MKKLFVIIASVVLATSLFAQEKVKLVLKNVDGTETIREVNRNETKLSFIELHATSILGLELLPNLEEIVFVSMSDMKDFSFLKNAKKLKTLFMYYGSPSNLDFLNSITSLENFVLTDARDTCVDFDFRKMKNLKVVVFQGAYATSPDFLYTMPKGLELLGLSYVKVKNVDFSKLRNIPYVVFSTDASLDTKKYDNVVSGFGYLPKEYQKFAP